MLERTIADYNILAKLGEGGMGVVYLAEDTRLDRKVALKLLPASTTESDEDKRRFEQEARAAARLNHPNICTIHAFDEHEGRPRRAVGLRGHCEDEQHDAYDGLRGLDHNVPYFAGHMLPSGSRMPERC